MFSVLVMSDVCSHVYPFQITLVLNGPHEKVNPARTRDQYIQGFNQEIEK